MLDTENPPTTTTSVVSPTTEISVIQVETVHAVPMIHPDDPPAPDPGWDYLDLGAYVAARLRVARGFEDEANKSARRSSVEVWYAGAALKIIRDTEGKDKGWVAWIEANRLSVTTCYQAMRLHDRSRSVENVRHLTIGEARVKYQVEKAKWTVPSLKPVPKAPKLPDATPPTTTSVVSPTPGSTESTSILDEATIEDLQTDTGGTDAPILGRVESFGHVVDTLTDMLTEMDEDDWRSPEARSLLPKLETAMAIIQKATMQIIQDKPRRKRGKKGVASEPA